MRAYVTPRRQGDPLDQITILMSREDWTSLASRVEKREREINRIHPNLVIPNQIWSALSRTDEMMVRVNVPKVTAALILEAVGE